MAVVVKQNGNIYEISFKYDVNMISIVKSVPGREWNPNKKVWTIPKDKLGFLIKAVEGTNYEQLTIISDEQINVNAELESTRLIPNIDISGVPFYVQNGGKPYSHQLDFMKFAIDRENKGNMNGFILADEMGCITGDTIVHVCYREHYKSITLRELYNDWTKRSHHRGYSIRCLKCREFGMHEIRDVLYSGVKPVYCIKFNYGKSLKATADHEILTSTGFVELQNLKVGDAVVTNASGSRPSLVKVIDISYVGEEDTFDVKMFDPYRNFVANGIVVHNCGKTLETMNLAMYNKTTYGVKHCLIICCVNSAKYNWLNDIAKHTNGGETAYILGTRRKRNGKLKYDGSSSDKYEDLKKFKTCDGKKLPYFIIMNIEAIRYKTKKYYPIMDELIKRINNGDIGIVALDEVHRGVSPSSTQGKCISEVKNKTGNKAMWIPITGTPIVNKPTDAYMPLKLIGGHNYKNFYSWCQTFCVYGGYGDHQIVAYKNIPTLKSMLQDNMIRRLKDEVLDLPPKIHMTEYVDNTEYQQNLYNQVMNQILVNDDGEVRNFNPVTRLLGLRQVNGSPELIDTSLVVDDDYMKCNAKLQRLMELLEEAIEVRGEKVIVFSNWVEPLKTVYNFVSKKYKTCCFLGTMSSELREKHKKVFMTNPEYKVLLGTVGAAGTSNTFTVANTVIFYDEPWTPADKVQAEDRCMVKGTKINTPNGFVNIEDIKVGDLVFTAEGRVQKVTDCWCHEEVADMVKIHFYGNPEPITMTADHKVLTINGWKLAGELRHASDDIRCEDITATMPVVSDDLIISEIETGFDYDRDMYFINNFGKRQLNGRKHPIPEKIELSDDFLFFCGYYLGDGCCSKHTGMIQLAGNNTTKVDSIERCKQWFDSHIEGKSGYRNQKGKNGVELYLPNRLFKNFIGNTFGWNQREKHLPDWVFKLNRHQLECIYDGLCSSDGYFRHRYGTTQQWYTTATSALASGVWWIMSRLGYKPSISLVKSDDPRHQDFYNVICTINNRYKLKNGRIRSIEKFTDTVMLYDITVDTDSSFYSWGTPLHNCHRLGTTKPVNVITLMTKDTVDERVHDILYQKEGISNFIVDNKLDFDHNPSLFYDILGLKKEDILV